MNRLNAEQVKAEEERLRQQVRALEDEQRARFFKAFNQQVKDPDTYAALNFLFITGLHHLYLRQWLRGGVNLVLFLLAIACMLFYSVGFGLLILLLVSLVELNALFRSQVIIQHHNNELMEQILQEVKDGRP